MIATEAREGSAADSRNPLLNAGILKNVLSYVGVGHCLYVALVSKWWREVYITLENQQLTVYDEVKCKRNITCTPQMTLFSSVFASSARVKLAYESGLDCNSRAYWRAAGMHADIAALTTAHRLGMQYTEPTMTGAAQCNKLAEVRFLHEQGCPWPIRLLEDIASSGHFELLRWCHKHGCLFTKRAQQHAMQHRAATSS
jgi:hypothetical protein